MTCAFVLIFSSLSFNFQLFGIHDISDLYLRKSTLEIASKIKDLNTQLYGDGLKSRLDIDQEPSAVNRLFTIGYEQKYSTSSPTKTHKDSYAIAKKDFKPIKQQVEKLMTDMKQLEDQLIVAGAPYTPGRKGKE